MKNNEVTRIAILHCMSSEIATHGFLMNFHYLLSSPTDRSGTEKRCLATHGSESVNTILRNRYLTLSISQLRA